MGGGGKGGAAGKCCSCTPGDPDARWPNVGGSPIVTDRGYAEYDWGTRSDSDDKNPVSKQQQPKPCCPCPKLLRFQEAKKEKVNGADGAPLVALAATLHACARARHTSMSGVAYSRFSQQDLCCAVRKKCGGRKRGAQAATSTFNPA